MAHRLQFRKLWAIVGLRYRLVFSKRAQIHCCWVVFPLRSVKVKRACTVHYTFQQACVSRGLLQDDAEWFRCMEDACEVSGAMMAWQVRNLFAIILDYNRPQRPLALWLRFKEAMCEDLVYKARQRGVLNPDMAEIENEALWDIELQLAQQKHSLSEFADMPMPRRPTQASTVPEVLRKERNYDVVQQTRMATRMLNDCTSEQRAVVQTVLEALQLPPAVPKCYFLYACGGCGKTFLLELLLASVRGMGNIAYWSEFPPASTASPTHPPFALHPGILDRASCLM
jgi:hypothetical protein